MSGGFALLWGKTLDSSLWDESKEVRLLWITMLMMRDYEGVIYSAFSGLCRRARLEKEECRQALEVLLSPDPADTSKVEGGRRLKEVPGGWQIVNFDKYRFSTAAKREFWKEQKRQQREKAKAKFMKFRLKGMSTAAAREYEDDLKQFGQEVADANFDRRQAAAELLQSAKLANAGVPTASTEL